MDRSDLGSWLDGPSFGDGVPGERLGLPLEGPGSVARIGARAVALLIDWLLGVTVVTIVSTGTLGFAADQSVATRSGWTCLFVFFVAVSAFTWLTGASVGQRLLRIQIVLLSGQPLGFLCTLLRTALLCLVIPAVIYDRDGRGLHDKAVGTVAVRTR